MLRFYAVVVVALVAFVIAPGGRGGVEGGRVKNSLTQNKSQCSHSEVIKRPRQAAPGENFDTDNTRCVYVINVITSCHARRKACIGACVCV